MGKNITYRLEKIKELVTSPRLVDATDADAYLENMSVMDIQAVFDYCKQMYEVTGDRNFRIAMDRVVKTANLKRSAMEVPSDTPVSSYLQNILSNIKIYPIARRPGHPDGENQNSPNVTTG